MKKSIGMRLMEKINELSQLEILEIELTFGIFKNILDEKINEKVECLNAELDSKNNLYNIKTKFIDDEEDIINNYKNELKRIKEKFENRIVNISIEMHAAQNNQIMALANFKKISDEKKELINSDNYQNIWKRKKSLEQALKNARNIEEYNKYKEALQKIQDPLDLYNMSANSCIKKFNNYNNIINECLIEVEICKKEAIETLDSILNFEQKVDIIKKPNKINEFINRFKFMIGGKSKFHENVIDKMKNDMQQLKSDNEIRIKDINDKNIKFTAAILIMKRKINQENKMVSS